MWSAVGNTKEEEKKKRTKESEDGGGERIKAHRVKPHAPTLAIDALIGDEEWNGKRKKEQER